jgi:hypothetical protein
MEHALIVRLTHLISVSEENRKEVTEMLVPTRINRVSAFRLLVPHIDLVPLERVSIFVVGDTESTVMLT